MALISVSDFFSTGFYFILAIILFLVLLPFFILGGNIVYTFFFSILDFIIYLPKGLDCSIESFKKDWKSIYLLQWMEKYKKRKANKKDSK